MNGTVIVVDLADWLVIAALIANVVCSVLCVIESRRIRKRKPGRIEVLASPEGVSAAGLRAELQRIERLK